MYKSVPLYDVKLERWEKKDFPTQSSYVDWLWSLWKEPGQYDFDNTVHLFNEQAKIFDKRGIFCQHPSNSKDFVTYWEDQKDKCRNGAIYQNGDKEWFLPREYYMLLNFLKIYNKEKKNFTFIDVRDAQYHMALYEELAEHSGKHVAILKKRQMLSSYYHAAKLINRFWFDSGSICKLAASLGTYVKDTWRFIDEYRNFLNQHTAWYRPCNPDKALDWQQKIEITQNGKKIDVGLKSVMKGLILDKDPSGGVGGPTTIFFYDEAGIAPKMNQTLEFLLPALKSGMSYTGIYIAAGSVGDLADCEPLEELIRRPNSKDILAVKTNLLDDKGTIGECGLFIPEQWSMLPYVDEYGNSLVKEAVAAILEERERWKKELTPADYQLRISQKPLNIDEAFAAREESPFPLHLISQQIERIKNNTYYLEHVDLDRDIEGKIIIKPSRKLPISEFPIRMNAENKEGVIVMHERPVEGAKFGTYYASLDPISSGKTTSSNSLASIYIYKNATEVTIIKEDGKIEHRLEKGKIVCWWTGRFDDLKMTHQRIEMMLELYNAWCVIENNVSQFIQYMQERNKQRYLVPKDQLVFLKDIKANTNVYQDYGWRNVNRLFKDTLLPYGIEFLSEPLDIETKPDGEITKTYYGIERIPDIMLLKEMQAYKDSSGNYDRLIAYCALTALVAVQIANKGNNKERRYETKNLDKSKNNSNLVISPFKSIGNKGSNLSQKGIQRSAFKKLR
jgi:hypothetical protein